MSFNVLFNPFSFPFDQSKMVVDDHIDDFGCVAPVETIGAEGHHLIVAEDSIHFFLVINEIIPIFFLSQKVSPDNPNPS